MSSLLLIFISRPFLIGISDSGANPDFDMELDQMIINESINRIVFVDTTYGLQFGWDGGITNMTEEDMTNFRNLFLQYYNSKYIPPLLRTPTPNWLHAD